MQSADHIIALRRDSNRILRAADGRLDCLVPNGPGWRIADLVWHVGIVQMFWRMVATGALTAPEAWSEPDRPDSDCLEAWFQEGADLSATTLAGLDPDAPAWTWGRRNTVAFIQRRMAQETAVHCWDSVNGIGREERIERALAVDGVDEFLDEVLPGLPHDLDGPAQTIYLRAQDSSDQWAVRAGDGSVHVRRTSGPADAAVTADASDLLLLLWGHRSPDQLLVRGNIAALHRFLARADF